MFYLHCTTIISLILTFTCKYSAYSSMFIQFYIFWNSAILENNLRDLPSPRAPALQARKRFVLVLLRAFRSETSRKSKACPEDLGLVCCSLFGLKNWVQCGSQKSPNELECQKCLLLVDVVTILVNPEDPRSNDKDNCIK